MHIPPLVTLLGFSSVYRTTYPVPQAVRRVLASWVFVNESGGLRSAGNVHLRTGIGRGVLAAGHGLHGGRDVQPGRLVLDLHGVRGRFDRREQGVLPAAGEVFQHGESTLSGLLLAAFVAQQNLHDEGCYQQLEVLVVCQGGADRA